MGSTVTVTMKQAVGLLEELGNEGAEDFSENKINKLLKSLPGELKDEDISELDISKASAKLATKIAAAKICKLASDEDDEEEAPVKKKATKASNGKASSNGKAKAKAKPKAEAVEKDDFGSREGSEAGNINALIIKGGAKGISIEKLKEFGVKQKYSKNRITSHLRHLTNRSFVKIKDERVFSKVK